MRALKWIAFALVGLFVAASLLLFGGMSTMGHAQSDTPASTDKAETQQQSRAQQLMGATAPKARSTSMPSAAISTARCSPRTRHWPTG